MFIALVTGLLASTPAPTQVGFCPTCQGVLIGIHKIGRFRLRLYHRTGSCTRWFWSIAARDAEYHKLAPPDWVRDPDF